MAVRDDVHIVMLDQGTFPPEADLSGPKAPHRITFYNRTAPEQVAERIADADIVITNKVPITRESLQSAPNLKLIAVAATGYDVIDVQACAAQNVLVCNVRDYAYNTVPEHTFALILALRRSVMAYHKSVAAGRWQESGQFCYFDFPINDLSGSTIGIIGDGTIGKAVGNIAQGFGMNVLRAARRGAPPKSDRYLPFEEVLAASDIITLHVPLGPETRGVIDAAAFGLMARRPLIINTGRGGLVDEDALCKALISGQISGAGFDVTAVEPIVDGHPFFDLMDRDDFILTPHVAWASREATQVVADQVFGNVDAFLGGEPKNIISVK